MQTLEFPARGRFAAALLAKVGATVTLRTVSGADITGTLTAVTNDDMATLTAGATVWTIPVARIVALGAG